MDHDPIPPHLLFAAHDLYARAGGLDVDPADRPPIYKVIGIILAAASGLFIGVSFVLKKVGLLKANEKYNEEAGEGYGYLKNGYWWGGMVLMILGEICNFVAYAFTDAILVTPLGALSVVVTTILSAIFLKERLSLIGKVSCFLCIVGSVVIAINAPAKSAVATIQQMQSFVVHPAFLSYAGVIIVGSCVCAFWAAPKWGKKNMLVYITICSWVGGLSVVATQGLGAAVITQAEGTPQFNQWFLYVLLVFVIATLLVEIVYLNKALNIFNAAMVTPTYYVYFTTTTIITSAVLFRGFRGSPSEIVSIVMGFLTICAGVVLLQLSKSAKDVPDTAVFAGNLDQIHTIADQEQPETEPKADSIRGTAAIVRRISTARQKMEMEELRRLHQEKLMEQQHQLDQVDEDGGPMYEWDGLRRRKTGKFGSQSTRARSGTNSSLFTLPRTPEVHPPLGMTRFPTEHDRIDEEDRNRPTSAGVLSSIGGTIRTRARSFLSSTQAKYSADPTQQSPLHPVALTEMPMTGQNRRAGGDAIDQHDFIDTEYTGAKGFYNGRTNSQRSDLSSGSSHLAPTPPPHTTRRMFSFQNMFRRSQQPPVPEEDHPELYHRPSYHVSRSALGSRGHYGPQVRHATEEERLGLVERDSLPRSPLGQHGRSVMREDDGALDSDFDSDNDKYPRPAPGSSSPPQYHESKYGRGLTGSPPRRERDDEKLEYESPRGRSNTFRGRGHDSPSSSPSPPPPPPHRNLRMRHDRDESLL
ncbi:hypothetical protein ACRALDRAFT_1091162 [Sodiomyces alcalophilus JCM 7366]|uniref:uncharacterized protein n=1 Tax=Sodiomyces alcalophilus JCM 7366 TaxID=591952 RepID=UPI0039B664C5